jgi:hypothetical protein
MISQPELFGATFVRRFPHFLTQLQQTLEISKLDFILGQLRQGFLYSDKVYTAQLSDQVALMQPIYRSLLKHADASIRLRAFELTTILEGQSDASDIHISQALLTEPDAAIQSAMLLTWNEDVNRFSKAYYTSLFDTFLALFQSSTEPHTRLAAAYNVVMSKPGFHDDAIQTVFVDALVNYATFGKYNATDRVLKAVDQFMLHTRIDLLRTTLPRIETAHEAHEVLRALLDQVFFGTRKLASMASPLSETITTERPTIDQRYFPYPYILTWKYEASPVQLKRSDILPFQQEILEQVMALEIPWMVHSNLLERYGLPPTRALLREWLSAS